MVTGGQPLSPLPKNKAFMKVPSIGLYIRRHRRFFLYLAIVQLVVILSNHQLFQEIAATPPGKINPFVHRDWPQDYYSQLAYITQGASGFWLRFTPYGTEAQTPGIFYYYFILIGKVSALTVLVPYYAYHVARIGSVELFVISVYGISRVFLGSRYAFWGALLGILGTVAPPNLLRQTIQVSWYPYGYPWWEDLDSLQRLYMPAHHLFGQAMLVVGITAFFLWIHRPKIWILITSLISFVLASTTFPPVLLPMAVIPPLAMGWYVLRESVRIRRIVLTYRLFLGILILSGVSLVIYLLLSYQERQGYPWNITKPFEISRWNNEPSFNPAMPYLFGILPILAAPAIVRAILVGSWSDIFIAIWAVIPYVFLPFADRLSLPKIRLVHDVPYLPFALLAVQTAVIAGKIWKKEHLTKIIFAVVLITTTPVSLYHLYYRIQSVNYFLTQGDTRHFYISKDTYDAYLFLRNIAPKMSVVLSDFEDGNMLPGFAPVLSVIGHQADTLDFDTKRFFVVQFFKKYWSESYAKDFLKNYNVSYVFLGPLEKTYNSKEFSYSFLTPIYKNSEVTIYKVEQ